MSRHRILLQGGLGIRAELQNAIDLRATGLISVVDSMRLDGTEDPKTVAVLRIDGAFDDSTDEGVGRLFPNIRIQSERVPQWIKTFHYVPAHDGRQMQNSEPSVCGSLQDLAEAICAWAVPPHSLHVERLHRQTLETEHRNSILELPFPDGSGRGEGDKLVYIPQGTSYWNEVLRKAKEAAEDDRPVLLHGPTGCGKEILARLIARLYYHCHPTKRGKFVSASAALLSDSLGELFGVGERVATGVDARIGLFERAQNGVLFLDEIGTLDPRVQEQLLRVLSSGDYQPGGGQAHAILE